MKIMNNKIEKEYINFQIMVFINRFNKNKQHLQQINNLKDIYLLNI